MNFKGYTKETLSFMSDLLFNNNKKWFENNRERFEKYVKEPTVDLVYDIGNVLYEYTENINCEPLPGKALFRINNNMRFSKIPYKKYYGFFVWEGPNKFKMDNSGFYFYFDSEKVFISCGIHQMNKNYTENFRRSIFSTIAYNELYKLYLKGIKKKLCICEDSLKRTPSGYNENLFIKKKTLYFYRVFPYDILTDKDLSGIITETYINSISMHKWIKRHVYI